MASICSVYTKRVQVTFIGCSLNSIQEPWHFCKPLPNISNRIDVEYMKALIRQGYQGEKETCIYIGHSTETRRKCGQYTLSICRTHADYSQATITPKARVKPSTIISARLYGTFIFHLIWLGFLLLAQLHADHTLISLLDRLDFHFLLQMILLLH